MFSDFIDLAAEVASQRVKKFFYPTSLLIKKIGIGLFFIFLSLPFWFLGLMMLLLAIFFYLAELFRYVPASVWTGGISFLVGIVFLILGLISFSRIK